jgi:hypothetical protein
VAKERRWKNTLMDIYYAERKNPEGSFQDGESGCVARPEGGFRKA